MEFSKIFVSKSNFRKPFQINLQLTVNIYLLSNIKLSQYKDLLMNLKYNFELLQMLFLNLESELKSKNRIKKYI